MGLAIQIETTNDLSYSLKIKIYEFVEKLKPEGVMIFFSEITRITNVRNAVKFNGIANDCLVSIPC